MGRFVFINIYCEQSELFSLFLFEQIKVGDRYNVGTIILRDGSEIKFERHKFGHINDVVMNLKSNNNGVVVFEDVAKLDLNVLSIGKYELQKRFFINKRILNEKIY